MGQVALLGLLVVGLYAMPEAPRDGSPACQLVIQGCGREHELCAPLSCGPEADAQALQVWSAAGDCPQGRVIAALETDSCEPTILSSVSSTQ